MNVSLHALGEDGEGPVVAVGNRGVVVVELLVKDSNSQTAGLGGEDAGAMVQGELVAGPAIQENASQFLQILGVLVQHLYGIQ